VRLWARTTSDYSNTFSRIRDAVAALPVHSAVLDGEAIVFRSDSSSDFEALKSRHRQAEAILVAYDIMEVDGQDIRPEPLEERRKRLTKLLSRKTKAMRDGIQVSEAITGDGGRIFRHACWMNLEGIVSKRIGSRYVSGRTRAWLKTKNPDFERSRTRCSSLSQWCLVVDSSSTLTFFSSELRRRSTSCNASRRASSACCTVPKSRTPAAPNMGSSERATRISSMARCK
jgi:bifunctional non-homologous end joining protein LigD